MIDEGDCGAIGGMKIDGKPKSEVTYSVSIKETSWSRLLREIITVYCEKHVSHINMLGV
jgi:hypothetical protein